MRPPSHPHSRRVLAGLTFLCLALSFTEEASAQDALRVASSNNFPPVNFLDADGEIRGFGVDLSDAVIRELGTETERYHSERWVDVVDELSSGRAHFIHDMGMTPERTEHFDFSDPILELPEVIFVLEDRDDIDGLESLRGGTVACVREHISHIYLRTHFPDIRCRVTETPTDAILLLLTGRVDAFLYPREIVISLAQHLEVADEIEVVGSPTRTLRWAMAVRKGDHETLERLNTGLAAVRRSGEYDRIYQRWFRMSARDLYSQRELARILAVSVGGALAFALLAFLLFHLRTLRRASGELQQRERHFRALIENVSDIITVLRPDGTIEYHSPSIASLGYSPTDLLGKPVLGLIHEDDAERAARAIEEVVREGEAEVTVRFRGADDRYRVLDNEGRLFTSSSGEPRLVVVSRDVSERVETEAQLQASREGLERAQRMEAIGQLAGGVAHDFNNLLTVITYSASELMETASTEEERDSAIEILETADRAAGLTRQLLAFGRRQVLRPEVTGFDEVVEEVERLLHRVLGEDIILRCELGAAGERIEVDRSQLEQVLMNLAVNARDAMPDGGELRIATRALDRDSSEALTDEALRSGCVELIVEDTGAGIADDVLPHIFEPFYSTKGAGAGTGLGLATVYGVVHQSGGEIRATSQVGEGTRFTILFPTTDRTVAAPEPREPRGRPARARILVVEDEDGVLRAVRKILESGGHEVLSASSPDEARRIADEKSDAIELLLTDIIMPSSDGLTLAEEIRERTPSLRVIFMSGYPGDALARRGIDTADVRFIQKPFSAEELLAEVDDVLLDAAPRAESPV